MSGGGIAAPGPAGLARCGRARADLNQRPRSFSAKVGGRPAREAIGHRRRVPRPRAARRPLGRARSRTGRQHHPSRPRPPRPAPARADRGPPRANDAHRRPRGRRPRASPAPRRRGSRPPRPAGPEPGPDGGAPERLRQNRPTGRPARNAIGARRRGTSVPGRGRRGMPSAGNEDPAWFPRGTEHAGTEHAGLARNMLDDPEDGDSMTLLHLRWRRDVVVELCGNACRRASAPR